MAEKLLLHMEYELVKHRVNIPWDNIAHRLSESSAHSWSAEAVANLRPGLAASNKYRLMLNRPRLIWRRRHTVPAPPAPEHAGTGPHSPPSSHEARWSPAGRCRSGLRSKELEVCCLGPVLLSFYPLHDWELTLSSSGDPTMTRPVPWTEPMEDLKMTLNDSAWALDALEAQDDAEMQAKRVKSASKDKKAVSRTRPADKETTYLDHSGGGGGVKDKDDDDEYEDDEDSEHDGLYDEDDEDQVEDVSHSPSSLKPAP